MGESEIRQFISDLAVNAKISASTQTVALSALLFLYRDVLKKELPYVSQIERAQQRKKLPVVFTRDEVRAVLKGLNGIDLYACVESRRTRSEKAAGRLKQLATACGTDTPCPS